MANLPRVVFSASVNYADVTAPTLVGAELLADGETFEITLSKPVTIGAGGNGGFTIATDGGAVTLAYDSVAGAVLTYLASRLINEDENFTDFDYTQPGNGVESAGAGNDLASFTNQHAEVLNSSEVPASGDPDFVETFEGTEAGSQGPSGYDNTGWVLSSASVNPNYATSPAPLEGSYSFRPNSSSRSGIIPLPGATKRHFYLQYHTVTNTAVVAGPALMNGSTVLCTVEKTSGTKLRPIHGTVSGTVTTDNATTGVTYHLWGDYTEATSGANGVFTVGFSDTGIKPSSGNKYSSMTNGDATGLPTHIRLSGLGSDVVFDKLIVSSSPIGDNP